MGNFIQTYTGKQFWPLDPRPEDFDMNDIAHSLAYQCRYAGHCRQFYSVAEHCFFISAWIFVETHDRKVALAALLHDAPEAYIVDVPRPLKGSLQGYKEIEQNIWLQLADRYELDPVLPEIVKKADERILIDERNQNMAPGNYVGGWPDVEPLGIDLQFYTPEKAEENFRLMFRAFTE